MTKFVATAYETPAGCQLVANWRYRTLPVLATGVGAEPWNIVNSPDGSRIFVANRPCISTTVDSRCTSHFGHVPTLNRNPQRKEILCDLSSATKASCSIARATNQVYE
jgi:hypothetical protein